MRTTALALAAFVWLVPAQTTAAPIQVGDVVVFSEGTFRESPGGEFLASPHAPSAFDDFLTYCVQFTEFINFSGPFRVTGISSSTAGATSKPLDTRVAWLYEQFVLGTFGAFGLTYNSDAHAGQLQRAIWHFMGEPGYGAVSNQFVDYFDTHSAPASIGNVRVLNLVNARTGAPAQDQLVYRPVPEPASLTLLGLGLFAVATRLRRQARPAR
jgi:hypothetical protein